MSRQYSPKTFLRQVRGTLLNRCLRRHEIDLDLNLEIIKPAVVDEMYRRLTSLPPEKLRLVEADFAAITDLASELGVEAIQSEAERQGLDFRNMFNFARNDYERVCWTFLEHPQIFDLAVCYAEMDRVGAGRWHRRFVGRGLALSVDADALQLLARLMQESYAREGRGRYCHIDHYFRRNPDRHCFFAYPEGYARTEFNYSPEGELCEHTRRPAFEVVFVYRPEDGLVEVFAPGGRDRVEDLEACFGAAILGLEELPLRLIPRAFDLSMFKRPNLNFPIDPRDGVTAVYPREVRLQLPNRPGWHPELKFRVNRSTPGIGDVHAAIVAIVNRDQVKLDDVLVASVRLTMVFAREDRRPKQLTFGISQPDHCTLKDSSHDQIARKYLKHWGIVNDGDAAATAARIGYDACAASFVRRLA